ncbi:hypothetical protein EON64_18895, partial [archaeon]
MREQKERMLMIFTLQIPNGMMMNRLAQEERFCALLDPARKQSLDEIASRHPHWLVQGTTSMISEIAEQCPGISDAVLELAVERMDTRGDIHNVARLAFCLRSLGKVGGLVDVYAFLKSFGFCDYDAEEIAVSVVLTEDSSANSRRLAGVSTASAGKGAEALRKLLDAYCPHIAKENIEMYPSLLAEQNFHTMGRLQRILSTALRTADNTIILPQDLQFLDVFDAEDILAATFSGPVPVKCPQGFAVFSPWIRSSCPNISIHRTDLYASSIEEAGVRTLLRLRRVLQWNSKFLTAVGVESKDAADISKALMAASIKSLQGD